MTIEKELDRLIDDFLIDFEDSYDDLKKTWISFKKHRKEVDILNNDLKINILELFKNEKL